MHLPKLPDKWEWKVIPLCNNHGYYTMYEIKATNGIKSASTTVDIDNITYNTVVDFYLEDVTNRLADEACTLADPDKMALQERNVNKVWKQLDS